MLLLKLSYIFYDMLDKILKSEIIEVLLIFPKRVNMEVCHLDKFVGILSVKKYCRFVCYLIPLKSFSMV